MKLHRVVLVFVILIAGARLHSQIPALWSILTYIQADNDLAPFAEYNVADMVDGIVQGSPVNVLVQWDQPQNNKTWRFKIESSGRIEDESLSAEMGFRPSKELVDAMRWVKRRYPAQHYGLVLWNHGSGIEDYSDPRRNGPCVMRSWMKIPGMTTHSLEDRGILYDDSQDTCLTNNGLSNALKKIKNILGRRLDLIGMDACLMAMLEVCFQVRNYVDCFVGSQELEPGTGWPYSMFLRPLTSRPEMDAQELARSIVSAYARYYKNRQDARDFTQSAIDLSKINALRKNVDRMIREVHFLKKIDPVHTRKIIRRARFAALEMSAAEYIDMHSFYSHLLSRADAKRIAPKGKLKRDTEYRNGIRKLKRTLKSGMKTIERTLLSNATGPLMARAGGLSIYYPINGRIHNSYLKTKFARRSRWLWFIKEYS